jgi:hypothetical protein
MSQLTLIFSPLVSLVSLKSISLNAIEGGAFQGILTDKGVSYSGNFMKIATPQVISHTLKLIWRITI